MEVHGLDQLIANLYNAAAGRMSWEQALLPVTAILDLWAVQLMGIHQRTKTMLFGHEAGPASLLARLDYVRKYYALSPRLAPVMALPPGAWMHCHEIFDDAFVARDPFYQEFLIPYGGRYLSATKLVERDDLMVVFGAHRGVGKPPLGPAEMPILDTVRVHLTQAVEIYLHLATQAKEGAPGALLVNEFGYPMFVVDAQRQIVLRNHAAEAWMRGQNYLAESAGTLVACDPGADRALLIAIRDLRLSEDGSPERLPTRRFVRIPGAAQTPPIGVYAMAMRPKASMGTFGSVPLALVLVHDPRRQAGLEPFIVAAMFDLTPAESRIAVALADGRSPDDIAKASHTSVATVRSQIKSIYAKTGATRQAELVAMLRSMPAVR